MQYDKDKQIFSELLSKYTKIGKAKILKALEEYTANDILQNPNLVTDDLSKIKRVEELKVLRNTYDNLKEYNKNYTINSPSVAANYFMNMNADIQDKEYFSTAFLDTKYNVLGIKTIEGAINFASVDTRELMKEALKHNAANIVISHNHPSGSSNPSASDLKLTARVFTACEIMGIHMIDHTITGNGTYYSVKENYPDLESFARQFGSGLNVKEQKEAYGVVEKKTSIKDKLEQAKAKNSKAVTTKKPNKSIER